MINYTPLLRVYAGHRRRQLARQNPLETQERQLLKLVKKAADTRFGRDHDFATIKSVADFQSRVPLRRYEDFWDAYWKDLFPNVVDASWPGKMPYFAVTSGTTSGTSKYIPVSHDMNRSNARAGVDVLAHHVAHCPSSQAMGGKGLMLGGSTELVKEADGVYSGDLSGIAVKRSPWWAKSFLFPPIEIALLSDWEEKVDRIAEAAQHTDIRIITGTPSWLLILFDKQAALAEGQDRARDLYPNLDLLVHGGVNFKPYRQQFEGFLDGQGELREVYPASEGFIALQDETPADGLRLMLDNGLFFEFVPVEELGTDSPTRHTLANAETGVNYALVLSSNAGCWAYLIGDTVRFVSLDPPRILITGRTSYSLSAFGEHLIEEEVQEAVSAGSKATGLTITDFSVGAVFPATSNDLGGHLFVIEADRYPLDEETAQVFLAKADECLNALNDDYRAHRAEGFGLKDPQMLAVPPGTFAAWMKSRGRLGGQNKVPRLIADESLFDGLVSFARERTGQS